MIAVSQSRRSRRCGGFSLVELSLVTALTSVLFGLALGLMISLRQADRTIRAAQDEPRERARFAARIRADIHAASGYQFDQNVPALILENVGGPDDAARQEVFYQPGPGGRWERRAGRREDASVTDAFHLPGPWSWRVEETQEIGARCLRASWSIEGDDASVAVDEQPQFGRGRRWEVVAMLGRDQSGEGP